jgi:hypothetical protein
MVKRTFVYLLVTGIISTLVLTCERNLELELPGDGQVENCDDHEDSNDYNWDTSLVVQIMLNGNSIIAEGSGATVNGSTVTITSAGTYNISGSLDDGQIRVNSGDTGVVRLILNSIDIRNSGSAPVYVVKAQKAIFVLAENSENTITDGSSYDYEDPDKEEPNAALFSKVDLSISGKGSLTVEGNFNDGIASKDGLVISGATIVVNSADDGIRGKDYLVVRKGDITVNARGDGLKSDNDEDPSRGYISIEDGLLDITSGGDAIQAFTDVLVDYGEITLTTGGGSGSYLAEGESAKGIKAGVSVFVGDGSYTINSADDAIHSNSKLAIDGGTYLISTGDDGIHADSTLEINGGTFNITESFEGIESAIITINDGDFHIVCSDDGLNCAGGRDGSGMDRPGWPGHDQFAQSGDYYLYVHGGSIAITATGDGIDVNGAVVMTDGQIIIQGPISNMNSALDYDASFRITGGFFLGAGSAGMAQIPDRSSTQHSVLITFRTTRPAGTMIHLQTNASDEIFSFMPAKKIQSVAFSSPLLSAGTTYEIYSGGSSSGTLINGLYMDGTYTPGTRITSFTISGVVTRVNVQ